MEQKINQIKKSNRLTERFLKGKKKKRKEKRKRAPTILANVAACDYLSWNAFVATLLLR